MTEDNQEVVEPPKYIKRAIRREDTISEIFNKRVRKIARKKSDPEERRRMMNLVSEQRVKHQRLAEQIRSEFDQPPKHKLAREMLKTKP